MENQSSKRLIVCCDGTWQKLTSVYPTNVVKIAQAIKSSSSNGTAQIVFYDEGVGSGNEAEKLFAKGDRILGGAFGIGIDNNIEDAYRFLCLNYEPGDEIYLFGFSRGAYTVRSLAGLIRCSGGLLRRKDIREAPTAYEIYRDRSLTLKEKERFRRLPLPREYQSDADKIKHCRAEAHKIYSDRSFASLQEIEASPVKEVEDVQRKAERVRALLQQYGLVERNDSDSRQEAKITLLGCWDTVGELGVPNQIPFLSDWINEKYKFHDTVLSSIIQNALHAVAIDEIREVFNVTPMQQGSPKPETQTLRQVWFPGAHGCIGGGSREESGLSDAALVWMMDQIHDLGLGLEFDQAAVEGGINPNPTAHFDNEPHGIYQLTGKYLRKIVGICENDCAQFHDSVKHRWHFNFQPPFSPYRPKNLEAYFKHHPEVLQSWEPVHLEVASRR